MQHALDNVKLSLPAVPCTSASGPPNTHAVSLPFPDTYERAAFIVDEQIAGLSLAVGNTSNGALVSAVSEVTSACCADCQTQMHCPTRMSIRSVSPMCCRQLGWYRGVQIGVPASAFNLPPLATSVVPITVPTLGLLGDSDAYISEKWMLASGDMPASRTDSMSACCVS